MSNQDPHSSLPAYGSNLTDSSVFNSTASNPSYSRFRKEKGRNKNIQQSDPKNIGNYVISKVIGQGTFGKVWKGIHLLTGEKVAVKLFDKKQIKNKDDMKRIKREIKIQKKVKHPNIAQLYEMVETEEFIYLILEYCSGGELFDYIVAKKRLDEKEACKYFQELISGIEYLGKNNISHRDLKPENLLIDFNKSIKIIDFGLSNFYSDKNDKLQTACGSPCYAAPEMIAGKKYNGLMTDIWSAGVVLYTMICGYLPFENENTSLLYKSILRVQYSVPSWVSKLSKNLLNKILVSDPSVRATIDEIRDHPWCLQVRLPPPCNIFKRISKTILATMEELGFNKLFVENSIKDSKHNHTTTTYYILNKSMIIQKEKTKKLKKSFNNMSTGLDSPDKPSIANFHPKKKVRICSQSQPNRPRKTPKDPCTQQGPTPQYDNYITDTLSVHQYNLRAYNERTHSSNSPQKYRHQLENSKKFNGRDFSVTKEQPERATIHTNYQIGIKSGKGFKHKVKLDLQKFKKFRGNFGKLSLVKNKQVMAKKDRKKVREHGPGPEEFMNLSVYDDYQNPLNKSINVTQKYNNQSKAANSKSAFLTNKSDFNKTQNIFANGSNVGMTRTLESMSKPKSRQNLQKKISKIRVGHHKRQRTQGNFPMNENKVHYPIRDSYFKHKISRESSKASRSNSRVIKSKIGRKYNPGDVTSLIRTAMVPSYFISKLNSNF
ncbi:unnamed protein product [Moneuplotes crassus]|uniref:non-specific serine/threonine protein kinase n=1 Tax=Euplotes crassus TaxID=5936 RepID=A0AAD1Y4G8_EUPCR|nr:unnamed protein product [Moneuplotes crassus]